jgi:hypothetical protein
MILKFLIIVIVTCVYANAELFCHINVHRTDEPDCITSFQDKWYSEHLSAMKEPSLLGEKLNNKTIYRFTWLRTFHSPFTFIINLDSEISGKLMIKQTNGRGGYNPGDLIAIDTIDLNISEIIDLVNRIDKMKFWSMKTHENDRGLDGAEWILEGVKPGIYHLIVRWSPDSGEFYEFCMRLIRRVNVDSDDIY